MFQLVSKRALARKERQLANYDRYGNMDLCACGSLMKCDGECRQRHIQCNGIVKCCSVWRLEAPSRHNRTERDTNNNEKSFELCDKERIRIRRENRLKKGVSQNG